MAKPTIVAERPHMPDYGVTRDAQGVLPWHWAEQRLHTSHNFWLASSVGDVPHLMPVWALWHEAELYFSTANGSKKAHHLRRNANCSMSTERTDEVVVMQGRVREITDQQRFAELLLPYRQKYGMDYPSDSPLFCLRPTLVFGFSELGLTNDATRWRFSW